MGIDRDPLLLVSLSEPMKLRVPPGEVEVRGVNNAYASEESPARQYANLISHRQLGNQPTRLPLLQRELLPNVPYL